VRRLLPTLNDTSSPDSRFLSRLKILGVISFAQLVLFVSFTYVWGRDFQETFLNLLFFLFGQAAPLGALVAVIVFFPKKLRRGKLMTAGVTFAWLIGIAAFFASVNLGAPKIQFFAAPLSVLIAFLSSFRFRRA